jgi:hypothetical protein
MTETQPGREPEQGAGPENEIGEQVGTGYADPGGQVGLHAGEPTDDLRGQARELDEIAEGSAPAGTPEA